ncbi:MAG: hypothetical protein KC649_07390, partial [Candidatus Omnitrophica bacterium]|nr:hypothetical protein [Candidatus Omnitrophota bacterium]
KLCLKRNRRLALSGLLFLFLTAFIPVHNATAESGFQLPSGISGVSDSADTKMRYATCQWIGYDTESGMISVRTFLSEAGHPQSATLDLGMNPEAVVIDGEKPMLIEQIPADALVDVEYDPISKTVDFVLVHHSSE